MPLYYIRTLIIAFSFLPSSKSIAALIDAATDLLSEHIEQEFSLNRIKSIENHGPATAIIFSPDCRYAFTGVGPNHMPYDHAYIVDLPSGNKHFKYLHPKAVCVASDFQFTRLAIFSPDSQYLLVDSSNTSAQLHSLTIGFQKEFLHSSNHVLSIAVSSDSRYTLTGCADTIARVWDITKSSKPIKELKGHTSSISAVTFSHDGKFALTSSHDRTTRLWNLATSETIKELKGVDIVSFVKFSPDDNYALLAALNKVPRLWNLTTGESKELAGHNYFANSVVFSPDSNYILTGSWGKTAQLWDILSGKPIKELTGHTDRVSSVAFSSNNKYALTGSYDTTVRLWSVPSGRLIQVFANNIGPVLAVAFTPDTKHALVGAREGISFWKIPNEDTFVIEELILKLQENQ